MGDSFLFTAQICYLANLGIYRIYIEYRKVTIEEVNKQLNDFDFDMIDNGNLSRAHLNGRGLHLHTKGMLQFAKNLIEGIRKL